MVPREDDVHFESISGSHRTCQQSQRTAGKSCSNLYCEYQSMLAGTVIALFLVKPPPRNVGVVRYAWKKESQQPLETKSLPKNPCLVAGKPQWISNLLENLTFAEADVLKVLRALLDRKLIQLNAVNQYYCS